MARYFDCPYLGGRVELTDEREAHIRERHPDLADQIGRIESTLEQPDTVYPARHCGDSRLFERWYDDLYGGKYMQVAVLESASPPRRWIVTAHISRKPAPWGPEWKRS